jgi:hypothetical protein
MAMYKKPFKANPPAAPKPEVPRTTEDNKRTFDARPKPSDDTRREERVRPSQHIDRRLDDPEESGEAEGEKEE